MNSHNSNGNNIVGDMQSFCEAFKSLTSIELTPAGIWERDKEGKKLAKDISRNDIKGTKNIELAWEHHPRDNFAKHRLERHQNIMVVDMDGVFSHTDDSYIYSTDGYKFPLSLYTTTSAPHNAHIYYNLPTPLTPQLPTRVVRLYPSIDIFTFGTVFENHFKQGVIHPHPIHSLSQSDEIVAALLDYAASHPSSTNDNANLIPLSKPHIYKAAKDFLDPSFTDFKNATKNKILKHIVPKEYIPQASRNILSNLELTYSLVNDAAAKLMATAEISTQLAREVVVKLVTLKGKDPAHKDHLDKSIFATLPSRDAITAATPEEALTLQQMIERQPQSETRAIFKTTIDSGKKQQSVYIIVDKYTFEPILFNQGYLFDQQTAQTLFPERTYTTDSGKQVWDDNIDVIEIINDPFAPQISYSEYYPILNTYQPTVYLKEVVSKPAAPDNLLLRAIRSIVEPDQQDLYLLWMAHIIFAPNPPIVYPFMASSKAGTGKSTITAAIPSRILGSAAAVASIKDLQAGWADVFDGVRLLSLEDAENLTKKEAQAITSIIKQILDPSASKIMNYKKGAVKKKQLKVALSISSNHIPYIDDSDRRVWCMEPAHILGLTEPLSQQDSRELSQLLDSTIDPKYQDPTLQEFTNHLRYYYDNAIDIVPDYYNYLYYEAPQTRTRVRWLAHSSTSSSTVVTAITTGNLQLLLDLLPDASGLPPQYPTIEQTMQYLLLAFNSSTQKLYLTYKWYAAALAHIQKDEEKFTASVKHIRTALAIDTEEHLWTSNIGRDKIVEGSHIHPYFSADNLAAQGVKPHAIDPAQLEIVREWLEARLRHSTDSITL